jgi:Flp pilus assembly protein TadD
MLKLFPDDESTLRRLNELKFAADFDRAEALHSEGRTDEAESILQAVIAKYPDDPEPYLRLAPMLTQRGVDAEAAELAARAAEYGWDDPNVVFRAAQWSWRGDPGASKRFLAHMEALLAERGSEEGFPFRPDVWHLEGLLAAQVDEDDEFAVDRFSRAFEAEPNGVGHGADLALQLAHLGRFREARDVLARALEVCPGDSRLLSVQEQLRNEPD